MSQAQPSQSSPANLASTLMPSPVGTLRLVASDAALVAVLWADNTDTRYITAVPDPQHPLFLQTQAQLGEYFAGTRRHFDLPLQPHGTPFQLQVWQALRAIPYGETRSYGDLATTLGTPNASRAVGAANGRNPLSIVVPCHRVIGATGRLTGFAGGMAAKAHLLALESSSPTLFP